MRQYFGDPDDCAMRKDYDDAMYVAKLPVCAECNETITDEYVDCHGDFFHRKCFLEAAERFADENTRSVEDYLIEREDAEYEFV